ncbi:uncharacterized protein DFL_000488 [Arthrobotrys flagrans]|uniref:CFEM domain-containing protein n=1 Tax=Arthrobotrys flagrans TaxID=97331 RepID=A0A437ADY0_ARTFL|nr:hypothetical protein DFL_000488 [Arthrobotrys flagrans]
MKLSKILSIFSAATVAVYSQGAPPPIPECAEGCIQGGLGSSNCDPTDFKCQCADTEALRAVMDCVKAKCQPSQIPGNSPPPELPSYEAIPLLIHYLGIIAAASAICSEYGGNDISDVLKSVVASATSVASEVSSRISSVTGSQKILTTATPAETSIVNETSAAPTPTGSPNGAGKNIIGGSFGFIIPIAGLVAIGL